jgi:class 3 adenylate cyclase
MSLADTIETKISGVLSPAFVTVDGRTVPETEDVNLTSGAVILDATYLYADMVDSTGLAQNHTKPAVAKIIRCYLSAATTIIKTRGGAIRSFDGDRVMGIFHGDSKNSDAAKAALNINWAVTEIIGPEIKAKWDDLDWILGHGVGIDTGQSWLVRGGVWGTNDLVSIGRAPNIAAKLSAVRGSGPILITSDVYSMLNKASKYASGKDMWSPQGTVEFGGKLVSYYSSSYWWRPE